MSDYRYYISIYNNGVCIKFYGLKYQYRFLDYVVAIPFDKKMFEKVCKIIDGFGKRTPHCEIYKWKYLTIETGSHAEHFITQKK